MSILNIEPLNLRISDVHSATSDKVILENTTLAIDKKRKYALLGKNGCGKSTLLKFVQSKLNSKDCHLCEQEVAASDKTCYEYFISLFPEIEAVYNQPESEERDNILIEEDFDGLNAIINKLAAGLNINLDAKVSELSGGWRMRLSIAGGILMKPKLLILDEPTNHLDLEATEFLTEFLQDYRNAILFVSHDQAFIDNVSDFLWYITDDKQLRVFATDYRTFRQQLRDEWETAEKKYKDYSKKLNTFKKSNKTKEEVEQFVKKNEVQRPTKPYEVSVLFYQVPVIERSIIQLEKVGFSYGENEILKNISFSIWMNSRITLTGKNGSGKSTLLKLIAGSLEPSVGLRSFDQRIRIGYYSQHTNLPEDITPVQYLMNVAIEKIDEQKARQYLGTIGIKTESHLKLIGELSGGQKSRTLLASLFLIQPHILLLDEPTNHLDIETIEGLTNAINEYSGGLVMITHDKRLIENTESEIYLVENQGIKKISE
jgi:ATPase subunit of ABC transporter with duplicated ATPase domains